MLKPSQAWVQQRTGLSSIHALFWCVMRAALAAAAGRQPAARILAGTVFILADERRPAHASSGGHRGFDGFYGFYGGRMVLLQSSTPSAACSATPRGCLGGCIQHSCRSLCCETCPAWCLESVPQPRPQNGHVVPAMHGLIANLSGCAISAVAHRPACTHACAVVLDTCMCGCGLHSTWLREPLRSSMAWPAPVHLTTCTHQNFHAETGARGIPLHFRRIDSVLALQHLLHSVCHPSPPGGASNCHKGLSIVQSPRGWVLVQLDDRRFHSSRCCAGCG